MIMMKQTSEPTSFEAYSRLLVHLHSLIAADKGDDQEADDIRDLMDSFWYKFTEGELKLARQLSANLYLLNPAEEIPYSSDERYTPELTARLSELREKKDYLGVLHLLSTHTNEFGAYRALSLIGLCYFHLGLPDVSILFAERAVEFASNKIEGKFSFLISMLRTGKRERAVELVHDLLANPVELELNRRLFCATVLLGESHLHDEEVRTKFVKEAIAAFEAILELLSTQNGKLAQLRADCSYFMGECAFLLGNTGEALRFLGQAINENPGDEKSLVLRGLLKLNSDSRGAMEDFSNAIKAGTQAIQAYYYVAYDAIASEDYKKCIDIASRGLRHTTDVEMLAELHEMIALSLIGKSTSFHEPSVQEARKHLRYAVELDPFNLRYGQRLRDFEEYVSRDKIPQLSIPKPSVKKAVSVESQSDDYMEEYMQGALV